MAITNEFRILWTRMFRGFASFALVLTMPSSSLSAQAAERRNATVEDVLKLSDIGKVMIVNGGVLIEYVSALQDAPNVSTMDAGFESRPLSRVLFVKSGTEIISEPFPQEGSSGYWLGDASPQKESVIIYSLKNTLFKIGVFSFATMQVKWLPVAPSFSFQRARPLWLSEEEVIISVDNVQAGLPDGFGPASYMDRMRVNWLLNRSGKEPSRTVVEYPPLEVSDKKSGAQLVRINIATGKISIIANGGFHSLRLSPTRKWLAAVEDTGRAAFPEGKFPPDINQAFSRSRLAVFRIEGEQTNSRSPCPLCNVQRGSVEWAGSVDKLIFTATSEERSWSKPRLFVYDSLSDELQDFGSRWTVPQSCNNRFGNAAVVGDTLVVYAPRRADFASGLSHCDNRPRASFAWFRADGSNWRSFSLPIAARAVALAPTSLVLLADNALWAIKGRGDPVLVHRFRESVSPIARRPMLDFVVDTVRPGLSRDTVAFVGSDKLYLLDVSSLSVRELSAPGAKDDLWDFSEDGPRLAFVRSNKGSLAVEIVERDGVVRQLPGINRWLDEIASPLPDKYKFQVGDQELSACAFRPPDYVPGRKYPVVIEVYPDLGEPSCRSDRLPQARDIHDMQTLLPSKGYLLLRVQSPADVIRGSIGERLTPILTAALSGLSKRGYLDDKRIGLFGHSQGYNTGLQVLQNTTQFCAAVLVNGLSDPASNYGALAPRDLVDPSHVPTGMFMRYEWSRSVDFAGGAPWQAPDTFISRSPVFNANRITTPLLLMHGDMDVFPYSQSQVMFSALDRLHRRSKLIIYWGEGHVIHSPANARDYWKQLVSWYDENLNIQRDGDGNIVFSSTGVAVGDTSNRICEEQRSRTQADLKEAR